MSKLTCTYAAGEQGKYLKKQLQVESPTIILQHASILLIRHPAVWRCCSNYVPRNVSMNKCCIQLSSAQRQRWQIQRAMKFSTYAFHKDQIPERGRSKIGLSRSSRFCVVGFAFSVLLLLNKYVCLGWRSEYSYLWLYVNDYDYEVLLHKNLWSSR